MTGLISINGRTILAAVIMAVSCFVIANTLIQSRPISITIQDETPIVVQAPAVYGATEVLTLVVTSWMAGVSAMYLYFEGSKKIWVVPQKQTMTTLEPSVTVPKLEQLETVNTALKVLQEPGKRILEVIVNNGGQILQKDLYLETNFSKAKISRTLRELEFRNIIQRKQYGGTKKIVLSDWMRKGDAFNLENPIA